MKLTVFLKEHFEAINTFIPFENLQFHLKVRNSEPIPAIIAFELIIKEKKHVFKMCKKRH